MTNTPSMEETLKAAQDLVNVNQRLAAVEAHKRNVDAENAARQALAERERETARSWATLLAAGWTPAELKRIPGFAEPRAKAPGRPRGSRTRPSANRSSDTAPVRSDVPSPSAAPDVSSAVSAST